MKREDAERAVMEFAMTKQQEYDRMVARIEQVREDCYDPDADDDYGVLHTLLRLYGPSRFARSNAYQIRRAIRIRSADESARDRLSEGALGKYRESRCSQAQLDWPTAQIANEERIEAKRRAKVAVEQIRAELPKLPPSVRAYIISEFRRHGVPIEADARDEAWIRKPIGRRAELVRRKQARELLAAKVSR